MKRRVLILTLTLGLLAGAAVAQTPKPSHMRGTLTKVDGQTITVATRDGPTATVSLMEKARVIAFTPVDPATIAPGAFVGVAAKPDADGQLVALNVVVFKQAAHGAGEGHFDWDLAPNVSMTNANVDAVAQVAAGRELTLTYKGGSAKILVPPGVPVVSPVAATRSDLEAGKAVFLLALQNPDGSYRTPFVAVAKDGVAPPM